MSRSTGPTAAVLLLLLVPAARSADTPVRLPHPAAVFGVAFAPDGRTLYTAADDGLVRFWDAATGKGLRALPAHKGGVLALAVTADGRLLASGGRDGTVALWDARSGRLLHRLTGHRWDVESLALSPEGKWLAASSGGRTGEFRTKHDGKHIR